MIVACPKYFFINHNNDRRMIIFCHGKKEDEVKWILKLSIIQNMIDVVYKLCSSYVLSVLYKHFDRSKTVIDRLGRSFLKKTC